MSPDRRSRAQKFIDKTGEPMSYRGMIAAAAASLALLMSILKFLGIPTVGEILGGMKTRHEILVNEVHMMETPIAQNAEAILAMNTKLGEITRNMVTKEDVREMVWETSGNERTAREFR